MDLVVNCYQLTESFPKHEKFGLISQIQRSAVSVPANIAEGRERKTTGAFLQHLTIAGGSLAELETHILIAQRLKYLDKTKVERLLSQTDEIGRMLSGLRKALKRRGNSE